MSWTTWSTEQKESLVTFVRQTLLSQQEEVLLRMQKLNESLANETKSSAGDKFETSREMINQEINQAEAQLANVQNQLNIFAKTSFDAKTKCQPGALFTTGNFTYFWSVALGKVEFEGLKIMCFSSVSPFAKTALDKKAGEKVGMPGNQMELLWVV